MHDDRAVGTETTNERGTRGLRARRRSKFERRAEHAIATRHAFRYLAMATIVLSAGAAVLVWAVDRRDFPTVGDAFWWALQTLSTVGYGDVVPHSTWGRAVGSVVIVLGVTFLAMLTAAITSYFIAADQERREAEVERMRGRRAVDRDAQLAEILERLRAIEGRLGSRDGG